MQLRGRSFLNTEQLSPELTQSIFDRADLFKRQATTALGPWTNINGRAPLIVHLFFEPSTRTKTSFLVAGQRLGCQVLDVGVGAVSSLSKGETLADMFLNIQAMMPDLLVVRFGEDPGLSQQLSACPIPVVSGGSGTTSHPTQALLDAYTIREAHGAIAGERVLICGDVAHSRVAKSNADLLKRLGAEIAFCAPAYFMPEVGPQARVFATIEEGLQWATVIMALRVQRERHQQGQGFSAEAYARDYGITEQRLSLFSPDGILLHPGPVNWGVELQSQVAQDPRVRILKQVENGVYVRAALLANILGLGEI